MLPLSKFNALLKLLKKAISSYGKINLAKKIKELADDKAQFADWSTRDDIKNQLDMQLTILLHDNGYPPQWDDVVFEAVMEQAENFKKYVGEADNEVSYEPTPGDYGAGMAADSGGMNEQHGNPEA
ncbi:hypothetical protein FACS1894130_09550 [Spirochaetia bacterium]|nr:hypothetical protein FACS1894130_09550 [Spirochaetia bacterium]